MTLAKIGARLLELRKAANMEPEDVAEAAGIRKDYYLAIEAGKHDLQTLLLYRILRAVGSDFGGLGDAKPPNGEIYNKLQDLLERSEKKTADWITGDIETFHELHCLKIRDRRDAGTGPGGEDGGETA